MSNTPASVVGFLEAEEFFHELRATAEGLAKRYVVFLVDHGRSSRSTHKFWWNHFEEACHALAIPCRRVPKASEAWPRDHRLEGQQGVYLFFTMDSLFHDRTKWFRAVREDALRPEDIVASWDPRVVEAFARCRTFLIGFRKEGRPSTHGNDQEARIVYWEPFAPLGALLKGMTTQTDRDGTWDFAYFGTLNPHNYDQFQRILRPLAARHHCRFAGKLWRVASPIPLWYGFSPSLVGEPRGLEILARGRVNLVLHNDYHRRARTLTERLFISAALGRPVVCDNGGAWRYFTPEEVPVGEDPETFLALCEDVLRDLRAHQEIARALQKKVWRQFSYLNTVVQFLKDIDSMLSQSG